MEKRTLLAAKWAELPPELQTDWQVVGRQLTHCGYTMGAAYCSFGCTHCYLPRNANKTPLPSLAEMKEQIDANRRLVGANGGLQITGGDVVDAYWRAGQPDELVEIVRYANQVGVLPMLMTHGQVLLENPEFLERLVAVGGLRKLSLHIDMTQAGRPGFPIAELSRESDLNPLRQQFVELIHQTRQRTGKFLTGAHTVTVSQANLDSIGDIVTWLAADRRRCNAIRILSFQPEAAVGRTRIRPPLNGRKSTGPETADTTEVNAETSCSPETADTTAVDAETSWARVCAAAGMDLPRDNFWFGHSACSNMTTLLLLYPEGRAINLMKTDPPSRAFWGYVLRSFGGIGSRSGDPFEANIRRLGLVLRHPGIVLRALTYAHHLMKSHDLSWRRLLALARQPPGVLTVALHNFMSEEEIAEPRSAEVIQRLHTCAFRGAVLRNGEWEAVPMCTMNAVEREQLYEIQIAATAPTTASPASATPTAPTPSSSQKRYEMVIESTGK